MHELIAHPFNESPKKNQVPNMARGVHRLGPISSQSHMLIEHHPSHLKKGTVFLSTTPF
jgi:hypothetical protein